jgi:hypothetical protein
MTRETNAVDDADEWRSVGLDKPNGFRTEHHDGARMALALTNRLSPARQNQIPALDRRLDDVRCTDEFGNKAINRRKIDVPGTTDLRNRTFPHDDNTIAEFHRFGLVMCHVDRGNAERPQQTIEFAA